MGLGLGLEKQLDSKVLQHTQTAVLGVGLGVGLRLGLGVRG